MKKRTMPYRDGKGLPVARVRAIKLAGSELDRRLDRIEEIVTRLAEKAGLVQSIISQEKPAKQEWTVEDVLSGKARAEMIQEYLRKHPQPRRKGINRKEDNDDLVAVRLLPSKTKAATRQAIRSPKAVRESKAAQRLMDKAIKKALRGK